MNVTRPKIRMTWNFTCLGHRVTFNNEQNIYCTESYKSTQNEKWKAISM